VALPPCPWEEIRAPPHATPLPSQLTPSLSPSLCIFSPRAPSPSATATVAAVDGERPSQIEDHQIPRRVALSPSVRVIAERSPGSSPPSSSSAAPTIEMSSKLPVDTGPHYPPLVHLRAPLALLQLMHPFFFPRKPPEPPRRLRRSSSSPRTPVRVDEEEDGPYPFVMGRPCTARPRSSPRTFFLRLFIYFPVDLFLDL
jgi:hypothetical protein